MSKKEILRKFIEPQNLSNRMKFLYRAREFLESKMGEIGGTSKSPRKNRGKKVRSFGRR